METSRRAFLGLGFAVSGNGDPQQVWVDHDGGWEDIVAIAILLRSPDVKVMGIATTPGIANTATARLRLNQLLETFQERDAKPVTAIPDKANILATGPLSGVAALIRSGKTPARVTWMGGAVTVPGNAKLQAEWNAAADAKALATVMASAVPLTICPLDLTNQFPADASIIPPGTNGLLTELRKAYSEKERFLWDELAAASLAVPGLFESKVMLLKSDASGRLKQAADGRKVTVLTRCDTPAFKSLIQRSLRS